jgi:hypothetical protein
VPNQGVSLHYTPDWLRSGLALSEDLPLIDQEFLPAEKAMAAGAVDDARPDRWGEQVIRCIDKPPLHQIENGCSDWYCGGRLHPVASIETGGERLHAYYAMVNPAKLTSFVARA